MTIDFMVDRILDSYNEYGGINRAETENFPNRENVVAVLTDLQSLIFPGFRTAEQLDPHNLRYITGARVNRIISLLTREIQKALVYESSRQLERTGNVQNSHCFGLAEKTVLALIEEIPELRRQIQLDTKAAYNGDPAAKSSEEVIVSYPGLEAIVIYRLAHFLFTCGVPVIPRIMSEYVHGKTGIDIHPGATIGESFFIDHGTGVVIGETTVIGRNVKIYQGVTLGALSVKKELRNKKRHPTIEDDVTIYSNATILGGETVIGKGSTIGGNTWVTHSIPPLSMFSQAPHKE
jgi:serine O-acetyltransferase